MTLVISETTLLERENWFEVCGEMTIRPEVSETSNWALYVCVVARALRYTLAS
jgi:hypothetical protein